MILKSVRHTGFTVANLETSLAFYRDVLGMTLIDIQDEEGDYLSVITGFPDVRLRQAFLKVSEGQDHTLELNEYASHPAEPTPRETNRPGNGHLCFHVDDIWKTYERFKAAGVEFVNEPAEVTSGRATGAWAAYFRDPDGITLELVQLGQLSARE